jgi:hypothetical protein
VVRIPEGSLLVQEDAYEVIVPELLNPLGRD